MRDGRLHIYILYLFFASLIMMGVSFSRFATTLSNTGADNTELPEIEFSTWIMDSEAAVVSLQDMLPGESRIITIQVRNWVDEGAQDRISDYNQSFTLELTTTGNLPLTFTLTEVVAGEISLEHPVPYRYISVNQFFSAYVMQTKDYTLNVTWPVGNGNSCLKDEIDYLELNLRAVQS